MPYCQRCRVELSPDASACPLCGALPVDSLETDHGNNRPVTEMHSEVPFAPNVHNAEDGEKLKPSEYRQMAMELLSVSIGIVLAVTLLVDMIFFHGITWSRFTSITLIVLWLGSAIPLILWNHPWLVFSVLGPTVLLAVFLWLVITGHLVLFLPLGLPITLLTEGVVISSCVLIAIQSRKGLNTVGIVIAAVGIVSTGVDIMLALFLHGKIYLSWSIIVALCAVPVAGFFFYLHYRVTNRASLRKLFRL
jgi:hypothetical protein